ncbi:hypothetical protein [Nodularia sphaerocarpa]|uniref:hypothetical protein n=1 Tax=Nodularia sphaerocarpa TaxID=137816 RepID=UPI001EFB2BEA|nr:hypothetical protein [Nodularia sphaerocarpa]MDB9375960.1 hypothetical protein [Nodularia sphaerocarpa CS-585]MDB9379762.1 hypothetical protein [Nodularia sphaerocarpa CS-585A2]ULP74671.1 hypothetical protein BDGGKGIB_04340 [Nodularia sphaerocarpa UHCC 0038]
MQNNTFISAKRLRICILIFYLIVVSIFLFVHIKYYYSYSSEVSYSITDYLINYEGGFVRRGLVGQIILKLAEANIVNPKDAIEIISLFSYIIFVGFNFFQLCKFSQLDNVSLSILLFSPSLTLFPINDGAAFERKEIFFLPLLILHLVIFSIKNYKIYNFLSFILIAFLGSIYVLIHEGLFLLGIPINLMLMFIKFRCQFETQKSFQLLFLSWLTPLLTFVASVVFRGNASIALQVCNSWDKYVNHLSCQPLPGALAWLGEAITMNDFPPGYTAKFLWIMIFLILSCLTLYAIKNCLVKISNTNKINMILSYFYFIPIIFTIPLYVAALDWGRWFFFTSAVSTLCLLNQSVVTTAQKALNFNLSSIILEYCDKLLNFLHTKIFSRIVILFLPLIFFMRVPHFPFYEFPLINFHSSAVARLFKSVLNIF